MRIVINLLLLALIAGLAYLLVNSINEPIKFKAQKDKREKAVAEKLKEIRSAQEMYRNIHGEYARDFDALNKGLKEGKFRLIKVIGDPDDPNSDFSYDTTYLSAIDSVMKLEINLDELGEVPYGEGKTFDIQADTITYQKTLTHVLEVGVRRKDFMGPFADPKYAKYDDRYDPNSIHEIRQPRCTQPGWKLGINEKECGLKGV